MKKLLSLALTLALSFSLTVPAFAANKAGDTTITDANGTYTLSKPILYTIRAQNWKNQHGFRIGIYQWRTH